MINIVDKSSCSGCTACYAICPKNAISMKADSLGFKYPEVDINKCINCNLCDKVCAFNDSYETIDNFKLPKAYAARQTDIKEVEKSRSGGIFAAISDWVLDQGGVVYGAGYDTSFRVIHKRVDNKQQRNELRGSKYVQSDMGDIFSQIVDDLNLGLKVLFSGTPCQTAGLSSFLKLRKISTANLIICDIVCHGVPSPAIWKDYLAYIERRERKKIRSINFRDKQKFGWTAHKESFKFDAGYIYRDTYTYTFYQHIMFRHSCCVCPYTNFRRTGDITLGDFWGWQKTDENINSDDKGVSLILVNTPKGVNIFSAVSDKIVRISTDLDKCLQPNLLHPSKMHPLRDEFENDYKEDGFEKTMKKYALMGWKYNVSNFIVNTKVKLHHFFKK